MIIYEYTLEDAIEEIDTFCYNWYIITLCYELWQNEIIDVYGEKMKLYKIADVGMNYLNEICACKVSRESCKRTFNATKKSGVLEYVRGIRKITEITKLKEYIVLNMVYNDWLEKNYKHKEDLKAYLKFLKKNIMAQIQSLPQLARE